MNGFLAALVTGLFALTGAGLQHHDSGRGPSRGAPERVATNDNRRPAGKLRDGRLELSLEIRNARWFPEAEDGPSVMMQAFAEVGRPSEIPGPLVRVPEGTLINITLRNMLPDSDVVVRGLHTRPATTDDSVSIPAGATRTVTFLAGAPGTYFYWATSAHKALTEREGLDSQLTGAIVVDPRDPALRKNDRIFVLGLWVANRDTALRMVGHRRQITNINGKSWPYTERFTFTQGDSISWRWINPTVASHPMHLHGFYFQVQSRGREAADGLLAPADRPLANTDLMPSGSTMTIAWSPTRPGNWLFHCHLALHMDGGQRLEMALNPMMPGEDADMGSMSRRPHDMAGMILGIHVLPPPGAPSEQPAANPERIRLLVQASPRRYAEKTAVGFVVQRGAEPKTDSVTIPAPPLLFRTGKPVRITVVNRTTMETAVHWHGMEIPSFPDGVPGWSGTPGKIFNAIAPADSFIAEFTPRRAGTFIYHSHMNEMIQTSSGMYGPLIVTDSARPFDPRVEKIILIGGGGPGGEDVRAGGLVNGSLNPRLYLEAGVTYRLRIIQIHPQAVVDVRFGTDTTLARWKPVAKDGADLPASQQTMRAAYLPMGTGETADFEFTPERPGVMRLSIATRFAGWTVPVTVFISPPRKTASGASVPPP